jgi:hypothetical protein
VQCRGTQNSAATFSYTPGRRSTGAVCRCCETSCLTRASFPFRMKIAPQFRSRVARLSRWRFAPNEPLVRSFASSQIKTLWRAPIPRNTTQRPERSTKRLAKLRSGFAHHVHLAHCTDVQLPGAPPPDDPARHRSGPSAQPAIAMSSYEAAKEKAIRAMDCDIVTPQVFRSIRWSRRYLRPIARTAPRHETDFCPA